MNKNKIRGRRNRRNNWFVPTEFRLFRGTEKSRNSDPYKNRSKLSLLPTGTMILTEQQRFCGGSVICWKYGCMSYNYGVSLPHSEHVDIFPVRLVSTFHRVFSVYLTLAIYLIYIRLYHCGRNKTQRLDPFLLSIKDSLHIHR